MTNVTNAQTVAFDRAIKAGASLGKAESAFAIRVADLREAGFTAGDLKGEGQFFTWAQRRTAELTLNKAQFATWADESLAQGVTKNGKRVDTERGKLVKRVNASLARIRKALAAAPEKRGAAERATPTESFFNQIDKLVKRLSGDKASDTFDFDPILARKHLVAMIKDLK